jgi:hypothetical protein
MDEAFSQISHCLGAITVVVGIVEAQPWTAASIFLQRGLGSRHVIALAASVARNPFPLPRA